MSYQAGFDIGGTFTDYCVIEKETGEITKEKVPTTPQDPSAGCVNGFKKLDTKHGVSCDELDQLSHGTTVATNALIEREGKKTGLIITKGFRDVTAIGREKRNNLYEYSPDKLSPLTERRFRRGIEERTSATGDVLTPYNQNDVEDIIDYFEKNGVESVAVSFLHSYANDSHEKEVKRVIEEQSNLEVSISSEILPEINEFERTFSTVINAYVGPLVSEYITRLLEGLEDMGLQSDLQLMQANGGTITTKNVHNRSLRLINSGPAAGVLGSRHLTKFLDTDNVITLDIGGTSADASIITDGELERTLEGEIDEIPLMFPQVDVRSIGAGGGSIAWINEANVLKVGPESAGADPGPVCYDNGGTNPTVTDAALALGYIDPDYFLGGEMKLKKEKTIQTLKDIGNRLELDVSEVSEGILDIATEHMAQALRLVSVEKGYDPRDYALMCYGGAGPLLASRVARKLNISHIVIPIAPGILSAYGVITADKEFDFSKSRSIFIKDVDEDIINNIEQDLREQASEIFDSDNLTENQTCNFSVDMKYAGQTDKIEIQIDDISYNDVKDAENSFTERYEDIYGHSNPESNIEIVTWRLKVIDETGELKTPEIPQSGAVKDAEKSSRRAFDSRYDDFREYRVLDRMELPPNASFEGPVIVEEEESTTVVDHGASVRIDEIGNMIIETN